MKQAISSIVITLLLAVSNVSAATLYVSQESLNPTPPYATWDTAATDIRDAVDAAAPGDEVVVTNGVYDGGLEVTKPLALLSVNGPQFTMINGGGVYQCAFLTDGASLTGFTLTNGMIDAGNGGGVSCTSTNAFLTNCVIRGNTAYGINVESGGYGGGASGGTLYNCTLSGNSAVEGGGAYACTLYNCALNGNSAGIGDGADSCTLYNCILTGNWNWYDEGEAASGCMLYNCTLNGNSDGGADSCTLYNCTLTGNSGFGAYSCTLYSCTLSSNTGFGADSCTLYNCTLTGNSGGGERSSTLYNCIVYFNTASGAANYDAWSTLNYCCTTPLPTNGASNIALDPQLASASHLSADSPCRGAGNGAYATGTDIDGEAWGNPPSIGCDEFQEGGATGPLTVSLRANYTTVPVGYPVGFTALIEGRATESVWDFGDGDVAINQPYVTHGWPKAGDYLVVLWAFNESQLSGVSASFTVHVVAQPVLHAASASTNPKPPYATWATAAKNIQQAVDAAVLPGSLVLVTNGMYPGGLSVTKPLTLRSVNGPQFALINGGGTNQCVSLTDGASLTGFTLTNGWGGAWCTSTNACLSNCVVVGNLGSGASGGTLYNCTLADNSADGGYGGGAYSCTLYNCTLTGNSAITDEYGNPGYGGGAYGCTLCNCIVYFNLASDGANYDSSSILNCCCTTPLPTNGVGNIALNPQLASAICLSADSPCRGAGSATYATGTDIEGKPWGNPPCIGCYEYRAGGMTGPLAVSLRANYTNVPVGYAVSVTALIQGQTTESVWDFGDGVVVSNLPYASHAWVGPGAYPVVLRAYNQGLPRGVSAAATIHVIAQPVAYVTSASANPKPPYSTWATAARNIQQAVDVVGPGFEIVVTNGVYAGGSGVNKPLMLRSVNGPLFTIINGKGTNRCVSLAAGASLSGFTLTNGSGGVSCTSTDAVLTNCAITGNSGFGANGGTLYNCTLSGNSGSGASSCTLYNCTLSGNSPASGVASFGGGASSSTLYNCTLTGNSADDNGGGAWNCTLYNCTLTGNWTTYGYGGGGGGGASWCTLYNCTLTGNSSGRWGGGADGCVLYNCTLTGNSAPNGQGGGADSSNLYNCTLTGNEGGGVSADWRGNPSTLYNCIVYFNTASGGANCDTDSILNYCCTTPQPTNGVGNITDAPQFADYPNGDLRLQSNSPCINAGNNAYVTGTTDLDGNARMVRGTVDIGAYEYQGAGSIISYAWLQHYGLPTDGSADYADPDHDGMNNLQEWICGTDPTNPLSALRLLSAAPAGPNVTVSWQSVAGVNYFLERSANLDSPFALMATNIIGQTATTTYTDTNTTGPGPFFYRVGVKYP